ncbi:hypothetical protein L6452_12886 [Arctium lappa]|uniref:Uncharacterized protein n=1 Tax=Arctium lappa TaxID=4217 RepID=A0ACB9CH19_ARCLA|nr:hypothetical protein L6452_12886 [Arctium lappa]
MANVIRSSKRKGKEEREREREGGWGRRQEKRLPCRVCINNCHPLKPERERLLLCSSSTHSIPYPPLCSCFFLRFFSLSLD